MASSKPGLLQEFYTAFLAKGIRPEMTRLTLARKIATIVLIVWKSMPTPRLCLLLSGNSGWEGLGLRPESA
jgi:hypothetical protein